MIDRVFSKFKSLVIPFICTLLGLTFLNMVFSLINVGNAGLAFYLIFADLIMIVILSFMLYSKIKGNKEWFRLSVIIFMSYTLVFCVKNLFSSMIFYDGVHGIYVILRIFTFFADLSLSVVAVTLVLTMIVKKDKFLKIAKEIINWAIVGNIGFLTLAFLFTVIGACVSTSGISWQSIPSVLYDIAFGMFFAILYNSEKANNEKGEVAEPVQEEAVPESPVAEVTTQEENKEEVVTESVTESVNEETVPERNPKKKVKREKTAKKVKSKKDNADFEGGVVDVIGPTEPISKKRK